MPLRTMACICPDGFYIGDSGECIQGMDELWLPKYIYEKMLKKIMYLQSQLSVNAEYTLIVGPLNSAILVLV